MVTTIDKVGRVVIPSDVRKRLGLSAGTELELVVDGSCIRLTRTVLGPEVVREKGRLVARPRVAQRERPEIDAARWVEEERTASWPRSG